MAGSVGMIPLSQFGLPMPATRVANIPTKTCSSGISLFRDDYAKLDQWSEEMTVRKGLRTASSPATLRLSSKITRSLSRLIE